ncbi:MAG: phosphoglucosamine mutase [Rudaea sp.]
MSEKKYFGTDGIRGRVGDEPITAEFMLRVGHALGRVLRERDGNAEVLIGKDTRVSGYMFESALEAGLVSAGAGAQLLGPMPTPAVAWLTRQLGASAGLVISASHNPYFDNGVKFFNAGGEKLSDETELAIEHALAQPMRTVASDRIGKAIRVRDGATRYEAFLGASVGALDLRGRRIVVDCAHGATYQIAPRLFTSLGADVVSVGAQPDGFNINDDCGAAHPRSLQEQVVAQSADLGIAFDGDGDRVQLVDHSGALADGDDIIYLLARDMQKRGRLNGPVVGTVMTNFGIERAIEGLGIPFLRSKVGDRHVLQMLRDHAGVLGGEASGHVLCLDRATTGDGILTALLVLDTLQRAGISLAEARAGITRVPQVTINVPASGGHAIVASAAVQRVFAEASETLRGRGRVVLRPSGTEPVVRVTVEGEDAAEVARLAQGLAHAVKSAATN